MQAKSGFRSSGVQEFRSSGVQEFRSSGVQEFRSSGVQEFRSSGVQELAWDRSDNGKEKAALWIGAPRLLNSFFSPFEPA
jgi:hypothetical protein